MLALFLVFSLSGCLLQRLYSIREQLCDFEDNFQIVANEGVRLSILRPILLDKDVIWLAGAKPTQVTDPKRDARQCYGIYKSRTAACPSMPACGVAGGRLGIRDGRLILGTEPATFAAVAGGLVIAACLVSVSLMQARARSRG